MRRGVVAALVLLAACGRSPSGPASPSPAPVAITDFSGYWSGTFTYKGCLGLHCIVTDRTGPFSLRLRQSANHVAGLFETRGLSIRVRG